MRILNEVKFSYDSMNELLEQRDFMGAYEESLRALHAIDVLLARTRLKSKNIAAMADREVG